MSYLQGGRLRYNIYKNDMHQTQEVDVDGTPVLSVVVKGKTTVMSGLIRSGAEGI